MHIAAINKKYNTSKNANSWIASCSLNPPGLCRIHLGHTERNESGTSVQFCICFTALSYSILGKTIFQNKCHIKLLSTHIVRRSSRMNTLTSSLKISPASYAHQSVLFSTNYSCIYEKYSQKRNVWSSAQKQSFISQNYSKHMNILA